mmetsp:Transcript_69770/g.123081  ORF Transcript_69770/g.123081 Transcript_69770/m.123081 type:complete len:279 (+) Transcript_69770:514-1350(+)
MAWWYLEHNAVCDGRLGPQCFQKLHFRPQDAAHHGLASCLGLELLHRDIVHPTPSPPGVELADSARPEHSGRDGKHGVRGEHDLRLVGELGHEADRAAGLALQEEQCTAVPFGKLLCNTTLPGGAGEGRPADEGLNAVLLFAERHVDAAVERPFVQGQGPQGHIDVPDQRPPELEGLLVVQPHCPIHGPVDLVAVVLRRQLIRVHEGCHNVPGLQFRSLAAQLLPLPDCVTHQLPQGIFLKFVPLGVAVQDKDVGETLHRGTVAGVIELVSFGAHLHP